MLWHATYRSVSETFLKHLRPVLGFSAPFSTAWVMRLVVPLTQVVFLNVIEGAKNSMLSGCSNLQSDRLQYAITEPHTVIKDWIKLGPENPLSTLYCADCGFS